jgi:cytochrome P450
MLRDFWTAGQDTITATIQWGLLFLIHNPQEQQKIFDEIERVVGKQRMITQKDRQELPFLCAAVNVSFLLNFWG